MKEENKEQHVLKDGERNKLPVSPFENIALSLSGGGYRATSFHLGALTYLSSKKWKDKM